MAGKSGARGRGGVRPGTGIVNTYSVAGPQPGRRQDTEKTYARRNMDDRA